MGAQVSALERYRATARRAERHARRWESVATRARAGGHAIFAARCERAATICRESAEMWAGIAAEEEASVAART